MIELQYYLSNVPDCLIYGLLAMNHISLECGYGFNYRRKLRFRSCYISLVALAGHPILALFAGMIAGGFAGVITGFLQTN